MSKATCRGKYTALNVLINKKLKHITHKTKRKTKQQNKIKLEKVSVF